MITARVQILITPEQRKRLEEEARVRGRSVASLVREAIDAHYGTVGREQRLAAVDAIEAMSGGQFLPPDELNRIVEEERLANLDAAEAR